MATDHHHRDSHGHDGAGPLNHETTDISLDGVTRLAIGAIVVLLIISSAMLGTYRLLDRRARAAAAPVSRINADRVPADIASAPLMDQANAMENRGRQPAGPKILTNEPAWQREIKARTHAELTTYGWVDQDAGVVRLPIARAKQLLLERGLPDTTPAAEPEAAAEAEPAPGT